MANLFAAVVEVVELEAVVLVSQVIRHPSQAITTTITWTREGTGTFKRLFFMAIKSNYLYFDHITRMILYQAVLLEKFLLNWTYSPMITLSGFESKWKRKIIEDILLTFFYFRFSRTGSALTAAGGSGATSSSSPSRHTSSSATAIGISAALAAAAAASASSGDSCYETNELEDLLFTERYPGKLCALCNLSERSTLGQVSFFYNYIL